MAEVTKWLEGLEVGVGLCSLGASGCETTQLNNSMLGEPEVANAAGLACPPPPSPRASQYWPLHFAQLEMNLLRSQCWQ